MAQQTKKTEKAKVISLNKENHDKETTLQQAEAAKKEDNLELAETLYKKQLQQKAFDAPVYTKLMVLYRKQKRYKEELALINKGLQHFKEHQTKKTSSKNTSAAITKLSKSLNKSLGLTDKKGNFVFEPEPIPTWKKRKATVEKRLRN